MRYIESRLTDPAFNLALEQYAFDVLSHDNDIFMLWQNHDSVIVGLHQNTMEEINRAFVERNGIPVIRRLSGGGAVFHDLGNLNFTFITRVNDTADIDFDRSCRPIADALIGMGARVEVSGRNDMTIDGKKFSGNARYYRDGRLMHHGTMLFDTDFAKMSEVLRVSDDKLISKGVKSIRARVTNLREYLDMTVAEFWLTLRESIAVDMPLYTLSAQDLEAINDIRNQRYGTWDWNYGKSAEFSIVKRRRLEGFGAIRISFSALDGKITDFVTDGDYFGSKPCADVSAALHGVRLERKALIQALGSFEFELYYEKLTLKDFVNMIIE